MSCNEEKNCEEVAPEIAEISLTLTIDRFDQEFDKTNPSDFSSLKMKYPYMFQQQLPDSVWIARMNDTLRQEIMAEVNLVFPDFEKESVELRNLFKHIKYYFPKAKIPKVVTAISDVDRNNKVFYSDTLLAIAVDTYLGKENKLYQGISKFERNNLNKTQLIPDVINEFSKPYISSPKNRTFIAQMLYFGKRLYLKDKLIPCATDEVKIGYDTSQIEWCEVNEEEVWRYFIDNEMLFSTDKELVRRFLLNAPFSKFFKEIDQESPGRIGQWLGWQIVRAYMNTNEVSLQELMITPADEIFKNSNYKPKKK
ncbi:gliding motility lipoprotein GldB [Spongiivirga citrea]|uniref:Gliding motility lipoprotein GldB n=1 Tax=Spongiivirga citrea TaxID=1481457 RepID=A0A6M0CR00_9FLAO|nr:gliding motility lipoprotein GldB [Spongiivirga citrea]